MSTKHTKRTTPELLVTKTPTFAILVFFVPS
jgi:hypothetical protein